MNNQQIWFWPGPAREAWPTAPPPYLHMYLTWRMRGHRVDWCNKNEGVRQADRCDGRKEGGREVWWKTFQEEGEEAADSNHWDKAVASLVNRQSGVFVGKQATKTIPKTVDLGWLAIGTPCCRDFGWATGFTGQGTSFGRLVGAVWCGSGVEEAWRTS